MGINLNSLSKLHSKEVQVGFSSSKMHSVSESTKRFGEMMGLKGESKPISMASLAETLNNGYFNVPMGKPVPGRPFMDNAFAEIKRSLGAIIQEALLTDNPEESAANRIKLIIQESMENNSYIENSSLTIAAKGSDVPLFDTGELYESVEVMNV